MARYNADMAVGQDSAFHKYKDLLKPSARLRAAHA
jgi:hypothetical protein